MSTMACRCTCLPLLSLPKWQRQKSSPDDRISRNPLGDDRKQGPRISLTKALDPCRDMKATYDTSPMEFIGHGNFGQVFKVSCKFAKAARAVKRICKQKVSRDRICKELEMLLELDHPYIIRLNTWFEDEFAVYLVTELATGGDLESRFRCPDGEARRLFAQLMSAVRYFHGRGIVHRDLKPENCLLTGNHFAPTVKVIDFGVAVGWSEEGRPRRWITERAGTVQFMAPEVLSANATCGLKSDIWSAGVVLYMLLTATAPFPEGCVSQAQLRALSPWSHLSSPSGEGGLPRHLGNRLATMEVHAEAADLVARMLTKAPGARPTAQEVLRHSWLAGAQDAHLDRRILRRVLAWYQSSATPMGRAVATATAHMMQEEELADIRSTFVAIDTDGLGCLTKTVIDTAYRVCGIDLGPDELTSLFEALDGNMSGTVTWTDWLTAALPPDMIASEDHLREAMMYLDQDMSGEVTSDQLSKVLGQNSAEAAVGRWDVDGKDCLSLAEIKAAMEDLAKKKAELSRTPMTSPV